MINISRWYRRRPSSTSAITVCVRHLVSSSTSVTISDHRQHRSSTPVTGTDADHYQPSTSWLSTSVIVISPQPRGSPTRVAAVVKVRHRLPRGRRSSASRSWTCRSSATVRRLSVETSLTYHGHPVGRAFYTFDVSQPHCTVKLSKHKQAHNKEYC